MRHPWLGIPFAAPRAEHRADHRPRPERPAHRGPRAMLAAPAVALTAWLGVLALAIAEDDSSPGDGSLVPRATAAQEPDSRPGPGGPDTARLR